MDKSLIIDLVALGILLISVIVGTAQGFSKSFVKTFGGIISLILAVLLCSATAKFLEEKFSLITTLSGWLSGVTRNIFGEIVDTPLNSASEGGLQEGGLSLWLISIILNAKGNITYGPDTTVNSIITPLFGYYIASFISMIVLYILFRLLFALFAKIIKGLYKVTLIKITDRILGLALGAIRGLLIVQLVILIINILPVPFLQELSVDIQTAPFTSFINKINIFSLIFNNLGVDKFIEFISNIVPKS